MSVCFSNKLDNIKGSLLSLWTMLLCTTTRVCFGRSETDLLIIDISNGYLLSQSAKAGLHPLDYTGNVDFNYANSVDDRRSVTGYFNFLAKGPVTIRSLPQQSDSLSTIKAKYMALAAGVQEVEHQKMVFDELRLLVLQPTIV